MSEISNQATKYIEQSKLAWLITVGEDKRPYVRPMGAFFNDGLDLYFLTAKKTDKVKQINTNPTVTFYFENPEQSYDTFKSVAVSGEAVEVLEESEFKKAVEGIGIRYPAIKGNVENGNIKDSSIYKINTNFIKTADYTKSPKEVSENI
ncbi:pyridoxamine 5'-phosphate oxidase family protein [Clostridium pasteurianum]|uniref:Putative stress protein (General stress protein 26) n=1 Tax=Clostridium pasteurianum BC1 TaxID=86416 RepID=R4KEB5_CLOPA|nr:pyridoxamine 5'-phosphate oxidase family protein [Clostridium pasteurianum]AGK98914.1 putative stress protein (general stress protein 26) [Clostridium pasteurianum BC1]